MITKKAYAKVNLSLDIVGRREDGYHLVRMVMQTLDIADILTFERIDGAADGLDKKSGEGDADSRIVTLLLDKRYDENDKNGISSEHDTRDANDIGTLPLGSDNLIYRVAELMMKKYVWTHNPKAGVRITLEKNIPIAAGMAGGSSDAAATFKGINELFELGIHDKELMEMGVTLGADIPYCIMGGTALSEGIGEELTRLPDMPQCTILVAKPKISVSTAEAYGGYDKLVEDTDINHIKHPEVDKQVDAVYAGNLIMISSYMSNVLELVTSDNHPEIKQLEDIMLEYGAINAIMSGSGPTVYGIFKGADDAGKAADRIKDLDLTEQIFITKTV